MASLLFLPPEIKSIIIETLDLKDIKNLRLSCRLLSSFLESLILHTISFDINALNVLSGSGIPKLQHLATKKSRGTSRTTKRLIINCISPEYDPKFETESYVNGQWVTNTLPKDTPTCIVGRKQMKLYLFHALASFKNVDSVVWTINQYDEEWVQRTVVKALISLPNLRSLRIDIDWARIPIPLHHIRNLSDITIIDSKPSSEVGFAHQTYLNLGKMIARSPQLCGIHIHRRNYDSITADISASLHHLFWCFPLTAAPLRLTSLSLNKMFVQLDQKTLPHMHYLKSLDLSNMFEPYNKPTSTDDPYDDFRTIRRNPGPQTSQELVGSSIDSIWLTLIDIGVQLQEIKVNKVTSGLLIYLETYSGAKKLHLRLPQNYTTLADSEELASRFFGSALGRHVTTLEDLHIEAADEGLWCFGENNKSVISACRKLHSLGISISPSSLKVTACSRSSLSSTPPVAQMSFDSNADVAPYSEPRETTNVILSLLDVVSAHLCNLHTLNLTVPTCIDRFEGYWCGYSVSQQFSWVCDVVAERLCEYTANGTGCQAFEGLPTVVIGEKTCKEKRLDPVRVQVHTNEESGLRSAICRWTYREVSS